MHFNSFSNLLLIKSIGVSPERKSAVIKDDLISLIEKKRVELIQVAARYGLTSSAAIRYSQELDKLLNEYNKINNKKLADCLTS
ncbi:Spo0E family sporulation regulatory protein-aspartic acid phosphatase [Neobacillus fumarioli]|uniref:Spo0E family sporulation regulatory protein-aspartic acid phosphatase n=1 Tax=Neobacillus fumarioli TaxID=105229 RepID=UPI00350E41B8